jgi:hypothetical protein
MQDFSAPPSFFFFNYKKNCLIVLNYGWEKQLVDILSVRIVLLIPCIDNKKLVFYWYLHIVISGSGLSCKTFNISLSALIATKFQQYQIW